MKRVAALLTTLGSLAITSKAFADITVNVAPPPGTAITPTNGIVGVLFTNLIRIIFVVAALAVLVMLIIGAFQWITSGGDKEAVGNARKRITNALIGLAILAFAFVIVFVVGNILGINILGNLTIPSLTSTAPIIVTPTPVR